MDYTIFRGDFKNHPTLQLVLMVVSVRGSMTTNLGEENLMSKLSSKFG